MRIGLPREPRPAACGLCRRTEFRADIGHYVPVFGRDEGVCRSCVERTAHLALTSPGFLLSTLWRVEETGGPLRSVPPERIEELQAMLNRSRPRAEEWSREERRFVPERIAPRHPILLAHEAGAFAESLYLAAKRVVDGDEDALALAPRVFFDGRHVRQQFAARLRKLLFVE